MKAKFQILLSIILLLIIISYAVIKVWNPFEEKVEPYFGGEIKEFCVNTFCYKKDDEKLNKEIIEATLTRWQRIQILNLISSNKDKFDSLGFTDNKVILTINGKSLEIGQITADYTGTLVKKENEDKVYSINVIIDKNNISNPEYWANKNDESQQNK
jgi:hypothetical protein